MSKDSIAVPVIAGLTVGIVFVVLFALLPSSSSSKMNIANGIANTVEDEHDLLNESDGLVKVSSTNNITEAVLTRGSTTKIPLTIRYLVNDNNGRIINSNSNNEKKNDTTITLPNVVVKYNGIAGITYVGKDHLLLDTNSIVTVSPSEVQVSPSRTESLEMQISIPKDWPEEAVGIGSIYLSPKFGITQISDDDTAAAHIAIWSHAGVSLKVTS